jgi:ATP-binding cassette subfamily G (WHITE) protein 2 (PDR)
MASEGGKQEWLPERSENILGTETTTASTTHVSSTEQFHDVNESHAASHTENYGSIVNERPGLERAQTSTSDTEYEKDLRMERTQTSRSARERRQFAPIRAGDAEELTRIATTLGGGSMTRTSTGARPDGLQRNDTLAGIELGNPILDPKSPEFDPYKWARM